jgi:GT2 family glycosyltransferase
MIKIAVYCVTYFSYKELYNYLQSLENSIANVSDIRLSVFIADNTTDEYQQIDFSPFTHLTATLFPFHENLGYFGAIRKMMIQASPLEFQYVILSNVDVIVTPVFFAKLMTHPNNEDEGWIAPATISIENGYDLNPQATNRYSLLKLKTLLFLYKHPIIMSIYEKTMYRTRRNIPHNAGTVYAGHGSFIILTNKYFSECGIIDYPVFLYGEEIYLGEMCHLHGLKVNYIPELVVNDIGKVSTGKMKRDFYYQCNIKAIKYLIDTYFS